MIVEFEVRYVLADSVLMNCTKGYDAAPKLHFTPSLLHFLLVPPPFTANQ
jgi:hypothetical protein